MLAQDAHCKLYKIYIDYHAVLLLFVSLVENMHVCLFCNFGCFSLLVCLAFVFIYISLNGCLLLNYACVDVLNIHACRCACICWNKQLRFIQLVGFDVFFIPKKKNYYTALFSVVVAYALHITRLCLVLNYSLIQCKLPSSWVSMIMPFFPVITASCYVAYLVACYWDFTGEYEAFKSLFKTRSCRY